MFIIITIYVIETTLDFVSFDDKNLQRQRKFVGEPDFPIQNSYTVLVKFNVCVTAGTKNL